MLIRKPSLSEWFLIYQLQKVEKNHAHLTFVLKVKTQKLTEAFGDKIPLTSILVKASSIWAQKCEVVRKQVFTTFYGVRIYENNFGSVNVPILMSQDGKPYTSVVTIVNAREKTIKEIQKEFSDYAKKEPKDLMIGKRMLGKSNNFFNRSRLKFIHFVVNNFPSIQEKFKVGTVSVSSLLRFEKSSVNLLATAKGPGSFSLCVTSFDRKNQILELGISWDHQCGDGHEGVGACVKLADILQGDDEMAFKKLLD